ncbi:hypothetical protein Ancab_024018 [Ancistrocladus abbreviatus]
MEISVPSPTLSLPSPSLSSFSSSKSSFFFNHSTTTSIFNSINSTRLILNRRRQPRNVRKFEKKGLSCTCLFGLGVPELVVIVGVAALVFGPKKLPEVGRSIGKTVKSFQQAAKEFESELKKEPDSPTDVIEAKPTDVSEEEKDDVKASTPKET